MLSLGEFESKAFCHSKWKQECSALGDEVTGLNGASRVRGAILVTLPVLNSTEIV